MKLKKVETSSQFTAILACLLGENWTTPRILQLQRTADRCILARMEGDIGFDHFLAAETDLIRNIHGIASVAKLDGYELGYLLGKVADLKGSK